jgi:hypothetical protein
VTEAEGAGLLVKVEVHYRDVAALVRYARNPRKHSNKQISALAAFIKRVEFRVPILVDGNGGGDYRRPCCCASARCLACEWAEARSFADLPARRPFLLGDAA